MNTIDVGNVKANLSRILAGLADGTEKEVRILRRGKAIAKLVTISKLDASRRIGCAKGKFEVPDDIDKFNPEILSLFVGKGAASAYSP